MLGLASVISAAMGFLATTLLGYWFVPYLKRLKFGQTIREDGPKWHMSKEGTPTMGGLMIILGLFLALVVSVLYESLIGSHLVAELNNPVKTTRWAAALGLAVAMGMIGFADDYIKVVKKRNLGLTPRQKTFAQLIVSAVFLIVLLFGGMRTTYIPFAGEVNILSGAGLLFWPIALFFVYGFTNAVNLTDGIDGLAASVTLVVCCFFMVLGGISDSVGANILASAGAGTCIGFVMWNAHPAKVFMGDTGSMFLGGLVVGLSFAVGKPVLLMIAGMVYLLEALSVILQVAHYKRTKKRIFKMTPIHHHFEMSGWSEEKIVFIFSLVTLICCIVALLPVVFLR